MKKYSLERKLFGDRLFRMKKRKLVTAALPYTNALPHLGNIVGSHLPADIFARYSRLIGDDVLFVGGSDEHGTPIEISAEKIGVSLEEFKDKIHSKHKEIYKWFNFSYDNYSRTSAPIHKKTTQDFFKLINDNGFVSNGELEQFYSEKEKRFLPDRYIVGTCPKCNYEEANGDQCETCGTMLDPKELINPKSVISGDIPVIKKTKHLFLDLDKIEDRLKIWISDEVKLKTQVRNFAQGWMKDGLRRRCITRDCKNGIPVPLEGFEDKVFYVWFDAPIGYLSATKEATPKWKDYWHSKDSEIIHFLGKDNIPFHTIFWPGMIMANGTLNLPDEIIGLQYLNYEGEKFSKSKNRGVFCENFPTSNLNVDVLRSYLATVIPELGDTSFSWNDFQSRTNNELIGTYGNFINRTLGFVNSKLEGNLRKPSEDELTTVDKEFLEIVGNKVDSITKRFDSVEIRAALKEVYELAAEGNKYFHSSTPWVSIKENKQEAEKTVYLCSNLARMLSIVISPFTPESSQNVWNQLNLEGRVDEVGNWNTLKNFRIADGHKINSNTPIFSKLESSQIETYKADFSKASNLTTLFF